MNSDGRTLKPYFFGSITLHGGIILTIFFLTRYSGISSNEVYRIDFIGPSNVIINRNPESGQNSSAVQPSQPGAVVPESEKDEFATHPHAPLPRPSMLSSSLGTPKTNPPAALTPPASTSDSTAASSGGDAAVATDMPNFPYPWYISQIRAALWNQWASKMPGKGAEGTVEFSILKDGSAVDIRIESSSGDQEIDYMALGAVQSALPFPPLPEGFAEKFLKVHVRFKSQ